MDFVPTGTGTLVEREESAIAAVVHILKVLASAALPETEAIDAVHLALKFALKASQFREGRFREHWVNVTRERIKKKREEHPKTAAERKRKKRSSLVSFLEKKKAKKQAAEEKQAKKQAAAEKLAAEKLREMLEKIPDHDIARALKCARPTSLLRLCKKYDISTVGLCADGAFDKLKEDYRLLLQGLKM
ncbi:hypothetical protein HKI87_02g16390 [Chloropicon roscoffensis]|uniref:Uncharacterized protein n=1 Tax=Chloropicon roscoffensis TaxID=1461544 RepID=A0AAX4P2A8_9CHLO